MIKEQKEGQLQPHGSTETTHPMKGQMASRATEKTKEHQKNQLQKAQASNVG